MQITSDVPLKDFSTMRLGAGKARHMAEIHSRAEISEAVDWALEHRMPPLMIGGGSNIFWRDEDFEGLLLVNKITGYEEQSEDDQNVYLTIGAGENWDQVVARSVESGLTGIEALSLIPGTTGATPIQNVGAYGQEIANTLVSLEAYDLHTRQFVTIPAVDCAFAYRSSRFKTTDRDRFLIASITLHLTRGNPLPPYYPAVSNYLEQNHPGQAVTPALLREVVIAIRQSKLPDPAKVANNGSFFANPIISDDLLVEVQANYPAIPHWPTEIPGTTKVPAAWLIEQAGFKDFHDSETGMATWPMQPLVLVNESAKSTADLLRFKQKIVDAVQAKFGIALEQEPELLP